MHSFWQWPYPDDHLSETSCKRLTTSLLKPKHDNGLLLPNRLDSGLLLPNHLYTYQVTPSGHSQVLPHLPQTLLLPCGLKKYKDHRYPVHLLQPNAQLKASHQMNQPVNALNTILFPRWEFRRMQTVHPRLHHHNLLDVQSVEGSLCTGC